MNVEIKFIKLFEISKIFIFKFLSFLIISFTNYLTICQILFTIHKISNISLFFKIASLLLYVIVSLLLLISFVSLSIHDPGSLEYLECPLETSEGLFQQYCHKCEIKRWKPPRAHHCSTCKKCIFKMDHHCNLVNNCIGYSNQKVYILFLFYTICSTLISLFISILFFESVFSKNSGKSKISLPLVIVNIIINFIIFLCSITFLADQLDFISTNSSLVELIINKRGENLTFIANFESIFGKSRFLWWLPVRNLSIPKFNENLYDTKPVINTKYSEIRPADELKSFDYIFYLSKYDDYSLEKKEN